MTVGDAVVNYPSNGEGGITATAASSELVAAAADSVVIDGILVTASHSADTTITIFKQDGTTAIAVFNVKATNAALPLTVWLPTGAPGIGMRVPAVANVAGFSAQSSNAGTKFILFYRRLRG